MSVCAPVHLFSYPSVCRLICAPCSYVFLPICLPTSNIIYITFSVGLFVHFYIYLSTCLSIGLCVHLSIFFCYLSAHLPIYLSTCLSVGLPVPLSVRLSTCPSVAYLCTLPICVDSVVHLPIYLFSCLPVCLCTVLPVYLPVCQSFCSPVNPSIYLPVRRSFLLSILPFICLLNHSH